MSEFFQSEAFQNALDILIHQFPLAIWETVYVTILSTISDRLRCSQHCAAR